jgi:hypothetical protein
MRELCIVNKAMDWTYGLVFLVPGFFGHKKGAEVSRAGKREWFP